MRPRHRPARPRRWPTMPPMSPTLFARFEAHRHSLELGFATVFVHAGADHAVFGDLARPDLRQPDRRADPPPHPGHRRSRLRQSAVQVPTRRSDGDIGHLGDTFNKMTSELTRQQTGLIEANALNDERRAFIEAVLSGVPAGVLGVDNDGDRHDLQRRGGTAARRGAGGLIGRPLDRRPAIASPRSGNRRARYALACIRARRQCCATAASAFSTSASPAIRRATTAQRHHARRHQRPRHRPAHRRLGRCRAPHRARDQESADADPAFGRAAQAPLRQAYRRGQGHLRPMHRHDHPPGRRHQADGGRVFLLRPHAQGAPGARRPRRLRAPGGVPDAGRTAGHRVRGTTARASRCSPISTAGLISQALTNVVKNAAKESTRLGEPHGKARGA